MKRKLDENGVPSPVKATEDSTASTDGATRASSIAQTFQELGLDTRLLQAIQAQGFSKPTPVQLQTIPLVLEEGKDVLAQARTGSGKTAAYLFPLIESILRRKRTSSSSQKQVSALILVPTRELASQVTKVTRSFTTSCAKDVRIVNLTEKTSDDVQRAWLDELPDIVVATPTRAQAHLNAGALKVQALKFIVLDEADLLFSYGYESDLQSIAQALPKGVQTIMASATLTDDVEVVKGLFCQDPVLLQLNDAPEEGGVSQYVVKCPEDDKFLLAFVIFKLKLVKGKCIVFVADTDRCYRLKLFFEQFGIKSCVLNSELPVNSRIHVVEEFNKNVYDIIIAADEIEVVGTENLRQMAKQGKADEDHLEEPDQDRASKKPKSSKKPKRDRDYGVSRGIDFKNVACVLNFDLPPSSKSYIHRIGRTGRAGRSGMALSFAVPNDQQGKHKFTSIDSTGNDDSTLESIIKGQKKLNQEVKDYVFDETAVDRFRYRLNDALRAVTAVAIREARTRELRQELINSDKLKRHFEENPDDLHHLRHDGELRAARVQPHLKHVPDYLLPNGGQVAKNIGFVGFKKTTGENRIRKARERNRLKGKGKSSRRNPLKTFSSKARK